MRIGLLSREWPPEVYGGAGVHVEHLVRALRARGGDVAVHSFGGTQDGATAHSPDPRLSGANAALQVLSTDLSMAAALSPDVGPGVDVVHSHTWYADLAGHVASLLHGVPHVVTTHSLEPHRPWKAEQLGGGYALSSWAERTAVLGADAVIAVSQGMARDVLASYPELDPARVHVVYNGIDAELYAPTTATDVRRTERPETAASPRATTAPGVSSGASAPRPAAEESPSTTRSRSVCKASLRGPCRSGSGNQRTQATGLNQ